MCAPSSAACCRWEVGASRLSKLSITHLQTTSFHRCASSMQTVLDSMDAALAAPATQQGQGHKHHHSRSEDYGEAPPAELAAAVQGTAADAANSPSAEAMFRDLSRLLDSSSAELQRVKRGLEEGLQAEAAAESVSAAAVQAALAGAQAASAAAARCCADQVPCIGTGAAALPVGEGPGEQNVVPDTCSSPPLAALPAEAGVDDEGRQGGSPLPPASPSYVVLAAPSVPLPVGAPEPPCAEGRALPQPPPSLQPAALPGNGGGLQASQAPTDGDISTAEACRGSGREDAGGLSATEVAALEQLQAEASESPTVGGTAQAGSPCASGGPAVGSPSGAHSSPSVPPALGLHPYLDLGLPGTAASVSPAAVASKEPLQEGALQLPVAWAPLDSPGLPMLEPPPPPQPPKPTPMPPPPYNPLRAAAEQRAQALASRRQQDAAGWRNLRAVADELALWHEYAAHLGIGGEVAAGGVHTRRQQPLLPVARVRDCQGAQPQVRPRLQLPRLWREAEEPQQEPQQEPLPLPPPLDAAARSTPGGDSDSCSGDGRGSSTSSADISSSSSDGSFTPTCTDSLPGGSCSCSASVVGSSMDFTVGAAAR